MALSYCSDWNSFQHINTDMPSFQAAEPEPPGDLLDLQFNFDSAEISIDKLLEQSNELFFSDENVNVLQYVDLPPENLVSISPDTVPAEGLESWQCPKRQKSEESLVYIPSESFPAVEIESWQCPELQNIDNNQFDYVDNSAGFMNGFVSNPCPAVKPLPEFVPSLPELPFPPRFAYGPGESETVQKTDVGLSPQSIAARQRRRKIAEKLQELGKLVPGGTKMNTAEMLQSAFKYVKFLQAQIGMMELMQSVQATEKPTNSQLQCLLPSPVVQEKLYSKEKCLIPLEFVQTLADDQVVECKPSVLKEIEQLKRAHNFPEGNRFD